MFFFIFLIVESNQQGLPYTPSPHWASKANSFSIVVEKGGKPPKWVGWGFFNLIFFLISLTQPPHFLTKFANQKAGRLKPPVVRPRRYEAAGGEEA